MSQNSSNRAKIQQLLAYNQRLQREIIVQQNTDSCCPEIEKVMDFHKNLLSLATLADSQIDTRYILAQVREPLSIDHLRREQERTAEACQYIQQIFEVAQQKKKEPKKVTKPREECKWKPEEHAKFIDALDLFGEKDLESITKFVGTRTKVQVRSHLQKYKLKLKTE